MDANILPLIDACISQSGDALYDIRTHACSHASQSITHTVRCIASKSSSHASYACGQTYQVCILGAELEDSMSFGGSPSLQVRRANVKRKPIHSVVRSRTPRRSKCFRIEYNYVTRGLRIYTSLLQDHPTGLARSIEKQSLTSLYVCSIAGTLHISSTTW